MFALAFVSANSTFFAARTGMFRIMTSITRCACNAIKCFMIFNITCTIWALHKNATITTQFKWWATCSTYAFDANVAVTYLTLANYLCFGAISTVLQKGHGRYCGNNIIVGSNSI